MSANEMPELLPCPFCGGPAEIVEINEGENAGGSCVCCTTCLASGNIEFEFKENYVANWNRRADLCASGPVRAQAFIESARFIEEMEQVDPPEPMTADMLKAVAGAGLREMAKRLAALTPAPQPTCRKCGGTMQPGHALAQTYTSGAPDDLGGDAQTMSAGGPGALIDCRKCEDCGWSVTADPQTEVATQTAQEAVPVDLIDAQAVADAVENCEGAGNWMSCSGCHELNDGYPTGPYSPALKCHLGLGCTECGGLGAIWDTTDYAAMGDWLAKELVADVDREAAHPPQPSVSVAEAALKEARANMQHIKERLVGEWPRNGTLELIETHQRKIDAALRAMKGSNE